MKFLGHTGLVTQGGLAVIQQGALAFFQHGEVAAGVLAALVQLRRLAVPGIQPCSQAVQPVAKGSEVLAHILISQAHFFQFHFLRAREFVGVRQVALGTVPVKTIPFKQEHTQVGLHL